MPTVAFDARDASSARPRGWARYARDLLGALERERDGIELRPIHEGGPGPELVFEQLRLPGLLRRTGADLVHAPNCFLPLRRPCPGVVTVHDLAFEDHPRDFSRRTGWKYRAFAPRAARSAERVICVSEFTREELCRRHGVDPARVRVVSPAPSLAASTEEEPPPPPYLLAVGDLRRKKNLGALVEAFAALRREGLPHRLVLAGLDAGAGPSLREAARGEPVELTGWIDDSRLDPLMRGADCLVHPSLHEGFGMVVLEAMARGTPVAAARAGALPETAGGAAELFDPLDPAALAAAVKRALERRDELAPLGRRRAAEFSWERAAREPLAVYRELV
jgi:glycosyltransferase involved in cell wall biosynthesis